MTDEVAAHVLAHNYDQTLGLSLQEANAPAELDAQAAFMAELEAKGRLDRRVEGLPRTLAIAELRSQGRGLTRPELAVLTAYAKLELSAEIVASGAPDDPYFFKTLQAYFPTALASFETEMGEHRLRREIIATVLANAIVDKLGPTFPTRLAASASCGAADVVEAFETARRVFRLDQAWDAVDALDLKVSASAQTDLYAEIVRALRGQSFWLARRGVNADGGVQSLIDTYRGAVDTLQQAGTDLLSDFERNAVEARRRVFVQAGAPQDLALTVSSLRALTGALATADLAREAGWPVQATARIFNQTGAVFGFDQLRAAAGGVRAQDGYERAALRGLILELIADQTQRTRAIMDAAGSPSAGDSADTARAAITGWIEPRKPAVERARRVLDSIEQTADGWSFAKLTIANAALRGVGG